MILCLAPNIALERTWVVPGLRLGGVYHPREEFVLAGGKALNVARAIRSLGGETLAVGLLAGRTGQLVQALAEKEGLPARFVWMPGETRTAVALVDDDPNAGDATLITENGPEVTSGDWQRLAQTVLEHARTAQAACFSGSLPPGVSDADFIALVRQTQELGCPVWVDSSGLGLRAAFQAHAYGIKANSDEIGELLNFEIHNLDSARQAAWRILSVGAKNAVVTLGAQGAVMAAAGGAWAATPPSIPRLSAVGSGDAFLGGLLIAVEGGSPPDKALRWATAAGAANAQFLGGGRFEKRAFDLAFPQVEVKRLA